MRKVGYIRVSTKEQNEARQWSALRKYVDEEYIVIDKQSGRNFERPGYQSLKTGLGKLTAGDELYILSLDRLGRNKKEIKKELEFFKSIGVIVRIITIATTMMEFPEEQIWIQEMVTNIIIEVLASMAEKEVDDIKQRQIDGIAEMVVKEGKKYSIKKKNYMGRPKASYPSNWEEIYNKWKAHEITATSAMGILNLKRNTFYKLANAYENNVSA